MKLSIFCPGDDAFRFVKAFSPTCYINFRLSKIFYIPLPTTSHHPPNKNINTRAQGKCFDNKNISRRKYAV